MQFISFKLLYEKLLDVNTLQYFKIILHYIV